MFAAAVTSVQAAGNDTPGYGTAPYGATPCNQPYGTNNGCPTPKIFINKTVQTPSSQTKGGLTAGGNFVDNLGVLDAKYHLGDTINFRIDVQNTGNTDMSKVVVTDTLPSQLSFTSGVAGTYDQNSHVLTYTINNLKSGQTNEVTIMTQVAGASAFPANQGVTCVTNQSVAVDSTSNQSAADTASVCIEQTPNSALPTPQVFSTPKMTKTPPTGPEMAVIPGLFTSGLFGIFLRRKSKS